ncbi:interferon-induced 44-like protein [Labeo rohita]|uniref:Interferon-induced 44-like protein n=1 Tax=Labeo rohita TaxID=84645 RepID=A0A498LRY8_LABRO|nr:interferon-induced 44-like protein [Labeo rohita]
MAAHSLTGKKSNANGSLPSRPQLDPEKMEQLFIRKYRPFEIETGNSCFTVVLNDVMGLEEGSMQGYPLEDIFSAIKGIRKDRVSRVAKYYAETAEAHPERRGGARHSEEHNKRRQLIAAHIQSFTCRASHYGRRGASGHKYLPSDLNMHKMYELFEAQNHAQTSYSLCYSVFSKDLNLGFGHPAQVQDQDYRSKPN